MTAKDFRASQIETSKLIASGGISGTTVGIAIYSGSIANDRSGGVSSPHNTTMFSDVGTDVFLFVSGSKTKSGNVDTSTGRSEVSLFGGDVVISGTLFAERQVIQVDQVADGDFFVTGNFYVEPDADSTTSAVFRNAAGTTIFNIDASNKRVGIGDNTPDALLDIQGEAASGVPSLLIDHDDTDQMAVSIVAANITGDVIDIAADAVTTANIIDVSAGALTSGKGIKLESTSNNLNAAVLLDVNATGTSTNAYTVAKITKDASNLSDSNAIVGLDIDFDGTAGTAGRALRIDSEQTTGIVAEINGDGITTGTAVDISTDARTTGTALNISDSATGDNAGSLVKISQTGSRAGSAASIGLDIDFNTAANANARALKIDSEQTTGIVAEINGDAVTTGTVIDVSADALTTGAALKIDDNSADTGNRDTVSIIQNNAAAIGAVALSVTSDGGAEGVFVDKNYSATANATVRGVLIDVDKTAATTSDNTIVGVDLTVNNESPTNGTNNMSGIKINATLIHAADAGITEVKAIEATATGGTNGASESLGATISATGADINTGIKVVVPAGTNDSHVKLVSSADHDDLFKIKVGTAGETTITTLDDGGAAANLIFNIDGNTDINSVGTITIDGVGTSNITTNGALTLSGSTGLNLASDSGEIDITTRQGNIDINAGGIFDVDITGAITIDSSASVGLGTANSGIPITIGHTTSETIINQNLTVKNNLGVNGIVSGSLGLSGSLTRLVDGSSYLIAGDNITVTSASNGAVTIASSADQNLFSIIAVAGQSNVEADAETDTLTLAAAGGMTIGTNAGTDTITFTSANDDTQNTLDGAYDEGGAGIGSIITVDGQPVQLKVAGSKSIALAVTGTVVFGSGSTGEGTSNLPPLPGNDTHFFVSGSANRRQIFGISVFGGDLVVSGGLYTGRVSAIDEDNTFLDLTATTAQLSANTIDINAATFDVDATSTITIDGVGTSNITTNGALTISGSTGLNLKADTGTLDIETRLGAIDIDAGTTIDIDAAGGINIGKASDVNFDIDTAQLDIDSSGAITIDGTSTFSVDVVGTSNITTNGALTLSGSTGLNLASDSGEIDITARQGNIDINATAGNFTLDIGGTFSLDGVGGSNITTVGDLQISGSGDVDLHADSGEIDITARQGNIDINATAGNFTLDTGGTFSLDGVGASNITTNGVLTVSGSTGLNIHSDSGAIDIVSRQGDMTISSGGNLTFKIDSDNDEASQSFSFENNASTEIANLNEAGDLQVDGDITVGGSDIKAPSGGGLNIAPALTDGQSLKLGKNGAVEVIITPHGTAANEIYSVTNTAGDGDSAIGLTSTAGGIKLTANRTQGITFQVGTVAAPGAAFDGASQIVSAFVAEVNGEVVTTLHVDLGLGGINSYSNNKKVIGDDGVTGTGGGSLTKITTTANGFIYRASIACVEDPAGGELDIDLWSNTAAINPSNVVDGSGTSVHLIPANGDWQAGQYEESAKNPTGGTSNKMTDGLHNHYLYLTAGTDSGPVAGEYTAGKLIIKLYGTPATF
jgi:hypothetical protein